MIGKKKRMFLKGLDVVTLMAEMARTA